MEQAIATGEPPATQAVDSEGLADLIARARSDPEAFGALYNQFYPRIYNFTMRALMNVDAAEDATAETFFKALKAIHQFGRRPGRFESWLYRIAANAVADHWRKRSREVLIEDDGATFERLMQREMLEPDNPAQAAERYQRYQRLHELIAALAPKYRLPIHLHYFEEKPLQEVAEILGCAHATARWRLFQARRMLARRWGNEE